MLGNVRIGGKVYVAWAMAMSLASFVSGPGCGGSDSAKGGSAATPGATAQATGAVTQADKREAKEIFANRCTPCHGSHGKGDGPASEGLTPKPRNFQDPAWQKSVTDEHIEKAIQYGGAAVGKSAAMPGNPDLSSRPGVVTALRVYVRNLEKK